MQETRGSAIIDYSYDANGSVSAFRYKANSSDSGTYYYYARNWLGDIVGIYNSSGTIIARYNYDAWGNPTSVTDANGNAITSETHIANINPFRYRSYYYDSETGLYYLNSRYYDPVIGRFISPDTTDILSVQADLYDKNLYAYCDNNPTGRVDVSGYAWETVFDVASLCLSMAEVATNPADAWAWIGLACDTLDLIPFVTGLGEVARAVKMSNKAFNTAKSLDNLGDISKVVIKYGDEIKLPTQIKSSKVMDAWDDFLGPNQTSYNRFTGKNEMNRIFSADGSRSIRFGDHEMKSIGTTKSHFHYEYWEYYPFLDRVYVKNSLQRFK